LEVVEVLEMALKELVMMEVLVEVVCLNRSWRI
jgi:hypothetical protein